MGMVIDAVNQGVNTYLTVSDRNRRAQMDEQERIRYEQQMARQAQLDEERRLAQDQQSNFQAQNQMMNSQNFENQQQTYRQQQDEYGRGLGLRQKMEAAGERSMSVPDDYSGQDFAPIPGDQGLRKRGMVSSRPEYLKSMQESDPANAPKYGEELSKLHEEGVINAALLLKQGRPREAAQVFNSSGGERLGPRGFFQDPKTKQWMAEESDGIVVFDPDKTLEYARQSSGQQEKPMILNRGDRAYVGGKMIAENPYEQGGGAGGDGGGMAGGGTQSARKFQELVAQGVPVPIARGEAYGLITKTQDPMGLRTIWTDLTSNEVVAELDDKGYRVNPKYANPQQQAAPPPQSSYKSLWSPR